MNDAPGPLQPASSEATISPAPAPIAASPAPVEPSFAPHLTPQPQPSPTPAFASSVVSEPANAHRATNPLLAMLTGALLSAGLLGTGILLGRSGAGGALISPGPSTGGNYTGTNPAAQVAREVGPAVMNVDTTFGKSGKSAFLPRPGQSPDDAEERKGKGTGFVFDSKNGYMLTNAHVAAGAKQLQVTTRDGKKITGKVLGYDRRTDIAVVQLADRTLPQVKLATFTDPKKLEVGDWTVAIGNPFGQENTVTVGVLSAVGRTLPVPAKNGANDGGAFDLTDMLQTDTAINPGNSGGPLINLKGEVIGINTAIIPYGQGIGFSIPINKAKKMADEIIKNGKVSRPYMGVNVLPVDDALKQDYGLPDKAGGFVSGVVPDSPADKAGIKQGDVIRSIGGKPVKTDKDVPKIMATRKAGESVKVEILRNNSNKQTVVVKIEDQPDVGE